MNDVTDESDLDLLSDATDSDGGKSDSSSSRPSNYRATLELVNKEDNNYDSWDDDSEQSEEFNVESDPDNSSDSSKYNEKFGTELEMDCPQEVFKEDKLLCRHYGIRSNAKVVLKRLHKDENFTSQPTIQELYYNFIAREQYGIISDARVVLSRLKINESLMTKVKNQYFQMQDEGPSEYPENCYGSDDTGASFEDSHSSSDTSGSDSFCTEDESSSDECSQEYEDNKFQLQAIDIVEYTVNENDLVCHYCSKVCSSKLMLNRHLECHDTSNIMCSFDDCDFITHTRPLLSTHLSKNHDLRGPKLMLCPLCNQNIGSKIQVTLHLKETHNIEYPYYCNECKSKPFYFAWEYSHHHQEHHLPMNCKICKESLPSKVDFRKHKIEKHPDNSDSGSECEADVKFNCPYCEEAKDCSSVTLAEHLKSSHAMKPPFSCPNCRYVSKALGTLLYHHEMFHVPTLCYICGVETKSSHAMKQHLKKHQKMYACKVEGCDHSTNIYSLAVSHGVDVHGKTERKKRKEYRQRTKQVRPKSPVSMSCSTCGETFESENKLNHHRFTDHEEGYRCPEKGCIFMTHLKNALVMHKHHIYKREEESLQTQRRYENLAQGGRYAPRATDQYGPLVRGEFFRCPYCIFQSRTKSQGLISHIEAEHGITSPFPCTECEQKFTRTRHLGAHIRRCHNVMKCPECKELVPGMNMRFHMQKHGSEVTVEQKPREDQCPLCEFKFRGNIKELLMHYKIAHELNSHESCKKCVTDFSNQIPDLMKHHKLHLNIICKLCNCQTNLQELGNHLKGEHSIEAHAKGDMKVRCCSPGCSFSDYQMIMNYHQEIAHTSFESLPCGNCQIITHSKESFLDHHKVVHGQDNILMCTHCKAEFDAPYLLLLHMEEKPTCKLMPQAVFGCQIPNCEYSFTELSLLTRHLIVDHNDECKSFGCPVKNCFFRPAKTLQELLNHVTTVHSKLLRYPCVLCGQSFLAVELAQHCHSIHSKTSVFCCFICDSIFSGEEELMEHQKTSHASSEIYLCHYDYCRKRFCSSSEIQKHMKTHYLDRNDLSHLSCEACGMHFSDRKDHRTHAMRKHCLISMSSQKKRKRDIVCKYCNKVFASFMAARNHKLANHMDQANHHCNDCGAAFFGSQALKKHRIMLIECKKKSVQANMALLKSKSGTEAFKCNPCNLTFKTEDELRDHKMKTENPKCIELFIACEVCGTKFQKRETLRRHMKNKHSDERTDKESEPKKKVQCRKCKEYFNGYRLLNSHGCFGKNECRFCGEKFAHFSLLSRHRLKFHSKEATHKCDKCESIFFCQFGLECHLRIQKCGKLKKKSSKKGPSKKEASLPTQDCNVAKTNDLSRKCLICEEWFPERESLVKHMEDSHEAEEVVEAMVLEEQKEINEVEEKNIKLGPGSCQSDYSMEVSSPQEEVLVVKIEPVPSRPPIVQHNRQIPLVLESPAHSNNRHIKASSKSNMEPKPMNLTQYPPTTNTQARHGQQQTVYPHQHVQQHPIHQQQQQQLQQQLHFQQQQQQFFQQQQQQQQPQIIIQQTIPAPVQNPPVNANGAHTTGVNYMSLDAFLQANAYNSHNQ